MNRIYILEDDPTIIDNLLFIIQSEKLGVVCGDSADGMPTTAEIMAARPDIILMDFLMPERDGVEVVTDLRANGCKAKCIMLSQISSKTLISKAYAAGIDFFINKPINRTEVCSVMRNVATQLDNERLLANIRGMFAAPAAQPAATVNTAPALRRAKNAMASLGMNGEKGYADLLKMCSYLCENGKTTADISVGQLCEAVGSPGKNMEQRARRAVAVGMSNLAHMGCEDFENPVFTAYAGRLFPYEEIRAEMDYIRKRRPNGGKVSLKKFLDGLTDVMQTEN